MKRGGKRWDQQPVWLWSERVGVFGHETALALYHLSDALPARTHLTLPASWKSRRLFVPAGVALHFAVLDDADRAWAGAVLVTTPARTVVVCATKGVSRAFTTGGPAVHTAGESTGGEVQAGSGAYLLKKDFSLLRSEIRSTGLGGSSTGGVPRSYLRSSNR